MKSIFRILILPVFLVAFAGTPLKSEEYVLCLQKQLSELGHDPGPHDGLWGKRTRSAAENLIAETPKLQGNPFLRNPRRVSAISWCRILGFQYNEARGFRPSSEKAKILFDKDVTTTERALLLGADKNARRYLQIRFGISLAGRVDIAAGSDASQIARNITELRRARGEPTSKSRKHVNDRCGQGDKWSAAAYFNQIYVCWPRQDTYDSTWASRNRKRLSAILLHEYVHALQTEYTLAKTILYKRRDGRRVSGPEWMMEGTAMLVELDYTYPGFKSKGMPSFFRLQSPARKTKLKLSELGDIKTDEEYRISLFAAYLLANRYGLDALIDYWAAIGSGLDWNEAFEEVFAMKLDDYEEQFETLRLTHGAAMAFANGGS